MLRGLAGEIESFARNRELLLGIESFCSESRAFARNRELLLGEILLILKNGRALG